MAARIFGGDPRPDVVPQILVLDERRVLARDRQVSLRQRQNGVVERGAKILPVFVHLAQACDAVPSRVLSSAVPSHTRLE